MRAVIVHGGSGKLPEHKIERARKGIKEAAEIAYSVLLEKGNALDACEMGVKSLEDNTVFNAGTGAVLTIDGRCELDASIMVGSTFQAGAVGAVENIKNPISLARKVMEETDHVLLVGKGAEKFARLMGFKKYNPITRERQREWRALKEKFFRGEIHRWKKNPEFLRRHSEYLTGTVGCVVLDGEGEIVAGTSTGGVFLKLPGRVGDTSMIGSGTYATPVAGASATGFGEGIMKIVLSKMVTDLVQLGMTPQMAADSGIKILTERTGQQAGIIVLDREGRFGFSKNTVTMPVAFIKDGMEKVEVFI